MSNQDSQNPSKSQNQSSSDWPPENLPSFGFLPSPEEGQISSEKEPIQFIHGNNSSTTHKQELHRPFDDFNPDYSAPALTDRLSRYATAHNRAVEMSDYIKKIYRTTKGKLSEKARVIAADLVSCGSFLIFHHFYTVGQIKLSSMCSCKRHLICPLCAIRRAAKAVQVYLEKFEIIKSLNPHVVAYLVTFTVKNDVELSERFEHLQSSIRKMMAHRRKFLSSKSSRHKHIEACKAIGGVGSYEIKRGSGSGDWHPHSHYIWLCESQPDAKKLSQEWLEITGDSFIVDVTPFDEGKDVSKGFLEVFKYALKYSTMTLEDNWEAFQVLQGRRLVSSFGIFHGLEIPEQLTDEISFDELPYVEMVYRFFNGQYSIQSTNQYANERSE